MRSVGARGSGRVVGLVCAMLGVMLAGCAPEAGGDGPREATQAATAPPPAAVAAERFTVVAGDLGADGLRSYWLFTRGRGRVIRARSPEAALSKWREDEEEQKSGRSGPSAADAPPDAKLLSIPIGPGGRTEA